MQNKHTPRCDTEYCSRPGPMELNGLRFVCGDGHTLETHLDEYPIYGKAPELLECLRHLLHEADFEKLETAAKRKARKLIAEIEGEVAR